MCKGFSDTSVVSEATAFVEMNLAPLQMRRDLSMLGASHKCAHRGVHADMCKFHIARAQSAQVPNSMAAHWTQHSAAWFLHAEERAILAIVDEKISLWPMALRSYNAGGALW